MKYKVQVLLLTAIIISIITYLTLSYNVINLIIGSALIMVFFPLQMLIAKFQWKIYNRVNKAPIINAKVDWFKLGAYICAVCSIFLSILLNIKQVENDGNCFLIVPGLNLGYLIQYSIKKNHNTYHEETLLLLKLSKLI